MDSCALTVEHLPREEVKKGKKAAIVQTFCDWVNLPNGTCYRLGGMNFCSCYCNDQLCNDEGDTKYDWTKLCSEARDVGNNTPEPKGLR